MSRVILQPASNKDARQHYEDTIIKPVPLTLLKAYLTPGEISVLADIYPDGNCPTWGVTPGTNNQNQVKWQKVAVGGEHKKARGQCG